MQRFKRETDSSLKYDAGWHVSEDICLGVLSTDEIFEANEKECSWSSEIEQIHEKPTKTGWIDVYERQKVISILSEILNKAQKNEKRIRIVELGASSGYMIEEMKKKFPNHEYIATDLMADGLKYSYKRNPDIMHIQCDCMDLPFRDNSINVIYALNMLEHISDDIAALKECYRVLGKGGYLLLVVPRGKKLYDYFDEILFHKRRYAKGELKRKVEKAGFIVVKDFHFACICYPVFWLKKKWNRLIGRKLSQKEKIKRVQSDIDNAMASSLAINMMKIELLISKRFSLPFGVREFVLCRKEEKIRAKK